MFSTKSIPTVIIAMDKTFPTPDMIPIVPTTDTRRFVGVDSPGSMINKISAADQRPPMNKP